MGPQLVKVKICLAGEAQVGKTSLVRRFVLDQFDDRYIHTLGAKVSKKEIVLHHRGEEYRVDLMLWDIMGSPAIPALMREGYFHAAQGIMAVCDATRKSTLLGLGDWEKGLAGVCPSIPWIVLANKADLTDRLELSEEDLEDCVGERPWHHLFTSAKSGAGVEEAFRTLTLAVLEDILKSKEAEIAVAGGVEG